MPDRTQELAEVFARLRWCVGGEFSVTVSPSQAALLLDALDWEPPKDETWPTDTADYRRENDPPAVEPWPPGPADRGKPRPKPDGGRIHG